MLILFSNPFSSDLISKKFQGPKVAKFDINLNIQYDVDIYIIFTICKFIEKKFKSKITKLKALSFI